MQVDVAVIGGSGLYQIEGVKVIDELEVETPFGMPSDSIVIAEIDGRKVAFLPRHGRGHRLLPSEVNYRANIYTLKKTWCKCHSFHKCSGFHEGAFKTWRLCAS